ncbi:MAG: hypothetical protein IPF54_07715 [Draconibacterium sp.]|nr:hypothetical protein [Draconibacterium sp.]
MGTEVLKQIQIEKLKKYTSLKGLNINNPGFQPRIRKGEYDTVRDEANIEKQTF